MTVTAEQLDLTRLPAIQLVVSDFDAEYAALKAGLVTRFAAEGVPYELGTIETDSSLLLAREFALHKTLTLDAINEAGNNLTLTKTWGAFLDQIAATYFADLVVDGTPLRRLVLVPADPATGAPAVMESDARFKRRILLAGQSRSHGTLAGYELEALTAAKFLDDALALNHASGLVRPGQVLVVLLGRDPDPNPLTAKPEQEEPAQIALAAKAIRARASQLATDEVLIRAAARVPVARAYTLGLRPGPDPALVTAQARVAHAAYLADRRGIGKLLAQSGEHTALFASGVEYVHAPPGQPADIDPGIDGIVVVSALTLGTEVPGG